MQNKNIFTLHSSHFTLFKKGEHYGSLQKRVMTPAAAREIGSDYIVVGRPITAAADPVAAYERCVAEFVG